MIRSETVGGSHPVFSSTINIWPYIVYINFNDTRVWLYKDIYFIKDLCFLGTKIIPADFIAPVESHNPISSGVHHDVRSHHNAV